MRSLIVPSLRVPWSKLRASTTTPGTEAGAVWLWDFRESTPPASVSPSNEKAEHTLDTNKPRAGCFQKGNTTQKGLWDRKPSQKHVGPPRGPPITWAGDRRGGGRTVGTAGVAQPQAATSRIRPAEIELRRHGSLHSSYLSTLTGAVSGSGV